ncbi:MAG: C-terminal target protein [Flavipsychrobacter sp.]|jgi:hypothetical protein|nr:C-terminal target protein [Flavipsychrobacter sp.]
MESIFMNRIAYFLILFCLPNNSSQAQILSYTTDTGGVLYSVATHVTGTPLTRVNGATRPSSPCSSGFSSSSFPSATTYTTGLPAVETSVAADAGFALHIKRFAVELRRSGTGPASVRLAYSTDGGITWIDQGIDHAPSNTSCGTTVAVAWTRTMTVTAPTQLKFRLYGFNASGTSGSLQILNLVINGSVSSTSGCIMPSGLFYSSLITTSATLNWIPVTGATNYNIRYRTSGTLPWTYLSSTGVSVFVSGLTAHTTYEYQVQARCSGTDTSGYTSTAYFTTPLSSSASSGKITVYFNNPVNNTVSTGVNAIYLSNSVADTIVAYINRAKYSIDIAMYNYVQTSGFANIATAINNAYLSGKRIRWIYDGSASNTGVALLNPGIHTLASPTTSAYTIMHNKFVIIDARSSDPNDAIVSGGSTNWTEQQLNRDFNNILFIQDSALAHAYLDEFNMMWGDTGLVPNTSLSKFGSFKTDLGRHVFNIAGKAVELYFSPSERVNDRISSTIKSANTDLYFGVFTFTLLNDANDIIDRDTSGVYTAGIVDGNSISGAAHPVLTAALGSNFKTYTGSYIYHDKLAIVDQSNTCSDPLVLTGSHNWTMSANTQNDENTLIIHDDTIANIYYQSFYADFASMGGSLTAIPPCVPPTTSIPVNDLSSNDLIIYPNPAGEKVNIRYNMTTSAIVSLKIYDVTGREMSKVVDNEAQKSGTYNYTTDISVPGIYLVKLFTGNSVITKKLVRL